MVADVFGLCLSRLSEDVLCSFGMWGWSVFQERIAFPKGGVYQCPPVSMDGISPELVLGTGSPALCWGSCPVSSLPAPGDPHIGPLGMPYSTHGRRGVHSCKDASRGCTVWAWTGRQRPVVRQP